jgi:hypothetical protein
VSHLDQAAPSDARQTLLRALDQIDEIEEEMGGKVWALCVCYSVTKIHQDGSVEENGGWSATSEPAFVTAAMLRRAARHVEGSPHPYDPDTDDDDEQEDEDD